MVKISISANVPKFILVNVSQLAKVYSAIKGVPYFAKSEFQGLKTEYLFFFLKNFLFFKSYAVMNHNLWC